MILTRGRDKLIKYEQYIDLVVKVMKLLPISFNKLLYSLFQNTKGKTGLGIRYVLLKCICKKCGTNVTIHPNVYLFHPERLVLGNNVSIHPFCYVDAVGEIEIKDDVSIAHGTTILSSSHIFNNLTIPIKDQGLDFRKTVIEENVWLGAKSTILYGLNVGSNSIVGTGSVVTKNIEPCSIFAGNPAIKIKER